MIIESKFFQGAWIISIALPFLILMFYRIRHHYRVVDQELSLNTDTGLVETALPKDMQLKVIVLVSKVHKGTIQR